MSFPFLATNDFKLSIISLFISCDLTIASYIKSSEISFPSDSIITTPSVLPETRRLNSLSSNCSYDGFVTNSLFIYPIFVAETGPLNGISEIDKAKLAPINPNQSNGVVKSTAKGKITIATS